MYSKILQKGREEPESHNSEVSTRNKEYTILTSDSCILGSAL